MEKKQYNLKFTFIDLFSGIGGLRIPFQKRGGTCVFSSEYDSFCQKTYHANFNDISAGDIRTIEENIVPDHDILLGGFPCQPFSIAGISKKNSLGRKHGFQDVAQGNLFFEIARIVDAKKPKILFLENVKNLKSHDGGKTYEVIENTLKGLGYNIFCKIIDARHYVPQHRERIFIICFRKDIFPELKFKFPAYPEKVKKICDILEKEVDAKYTLSDKLWHYLQQYSEKHKAKGNGFGFGLVNPEIDNITRTLSARYHKDGSEILIYQKDKNPRRLTPRECARLMGFDDNFKIVVSDTQAYRQFGNSVVVPVIDSLAEKVVEILREYSGQN